MISSTGTEAEIAAPKAAPASASSEIGVSKTRSAPVLLVEPGGHGEDTAGERHVLAEEDDAVVARPAPRRAPRGRRCGSRSSSSVALRIRSIRGRGRAGARAAAAGARGSARRRRRRRRGGRQVSVSSATSRNATPPAAVSTGLRADRADREDRHLRRVDHRGERAHAEHAEVRDRERRGRELVGREPPARARAPTRSRVSAAIAASGLRSASTTAGTSSASSVATAIPTFTRPWRSRRPSTNELLNAGILPQRERGGLDDEVVDRRDRLDELARRRGGAARSSDMSACMTTSNDGISERDCVMRRAIVWPVVDSSTTVVGPLRSSAAGSRAPGRRRRRARPHARRACGCARPGPCRRARAARRRAATAVRRATGVARARTRPRCRGGRSDGGTAIARRSGRDRRAAAPAARRRSPSSPAQPRDRLAERRDSAFGHEDLDEHAVSLGLVDDGRLVRLDLDQRLAADERLAGPLQPSDDRRLAHRVREARHPQDVLAHPLNSARRPGLRERRREAPALHLPEQRRDLGVDRVDDAAHRPRRPRARRAAAGSGRAPSRRRARPAAGRRPGRCGSARRSGT